MINQETNTVSTASAHGLQSRLCNVSVEPLPGVVKALNKAQAELRSAEEEMVRRIKEVLNDVENLGELFDLPARTVYELGTAPDNEVVGQDVYIDLWDLGWVNPHVSAHVKDGKYVFQAGFVCPASLPVEIPREYRVSRDAWRCDARSYAVYDHLQDGYDALTGMISILIDAMLKLRYESNQKNSQQEEVK